MARYKMVLMHGNRDAEGTHFFEAEDDLLTHSPATVMRVALEAMQHESSEYDIGHIDYELYSSLNNREKGIVTALGHLIFRGDQHEPFTAMISKA